MHAQLLDFEEEKARVLARLAPPVFRTGGTRSSRAGGGLELTWSQAGHGWSLNLPQDGSFEWELGERLGERDSATTTIISMAGVVRPSIDGVQLLVSQLILDTSVGLLRIACDASTIQHFIGSDGRVESMHVTVTSNAKQGLETSLVLVCSADAKGNRQWRFKDGSASLITWHSATGRGLSLDLSGGAVQFDRPLFEFGQATPGLLTTAQSSDTEWLVRASKDGLDLVGLLKSVTPDDVATSTQFRLRFRALTAVTGLHSVFGPCRTTGKDISEVRADVESGWESLKAGSGLTMRPVARLTGRVVLDNDFSLVTPARLRYSCVVQAFFSESNFDVAADGTLVLPDGMLVMARYDWKTAGGTHALAFQVPQRLSFKRSPSNAVTELSCATLVLLRPSGLTLTERYEVALACDTGPHSTRIGVRAAPRTGADIEGWLLRLPLRTSGNRCDLLVPAAPRQALPWFPVAATPRTGVLGQAAFWYERWALADVLGSETLAAQTRDQAEATFEGHALPKPGDLLLDWADLDAIAEGGVWMDSAQLTKSG